jgi:ABC-type polysaccharide/polyol phosphate transport system ATPase subunit
VACASVTTSPPHIKIVPLRTAMAPPEGAPTAMPIKRADYHVIFDRVSFARDKKGKKPPVFRNMSALLPVGRRIAIFGNTGAGKSMLLYLIAGVAQPDRGRVYRSRSISWPFGTSGVLDAAVSVRANVAFFAGAFNLSFDRTYDFVCYFAKHRPSQNRAVRDLDPQVRRSVGYAVAMAADYGCYLVDDRLPDKGLDSTRADFLHKFLLRKDLIFTTSNLPQASMVCDVAGVIEGYRLRFFRDLEEAAAVMEKTPTFTERRPDEDADFDGEDSELII